VGTFGGKPLHYEIRLRGLLDDSMLSWFEGMDVRYEDDTTVLIGLVQDASALYGVIARARDLGLDLISMTSREQASEGQEPPRT
jgi:hypothetical protein